MTARPQSSVLCITQSRIFAAILYSLLAVSTGAQTATPASGNFINNLMPLPATLQSRPGALQISPSFSYALRGDSGARITNAAVRFVSRLEMRSGVSLAKSPVSEGQQPTLTIDVSGTSNQSAPQPGADESYELDVD